VQAIFSIISDCYFFTLLVRRSHLQTRSYMLLGAVAASDIMFMVLILIVVGVLPYALDEPIIGGRVGCQIWAYITVFTLVLSMCTYTLMAYERYRAFCTPLNKLSLQGIDRLYGVSVVVSVLVAGVPFIGLGGGAAQPSGLYCNLNFTKTAICLYAFVALSIVLGLMILFYAKVGLGLRAARRVGATIRGISSDQVGDRSVGGPKAEENGSSPTTGEPQPLTRRASSEALDAMQSVVVKCLILTGTYLACWFPALVMMFLNLLKLDAANEPSVDITAALFATLGSSSSQLINFVLFEALRDEFRYDVRETRLSLRKMLPCIPEWCVPTVGTETEKRRSEAVIQSEAVRDSSAEVERTSTVGGDGHFRFSAANPLRKVSAAVGMPWQSKAAVAPQGQQR